MKFRPALIAMCALLQALGLASAPLLKADVPGNNSELTWAIGYDPKTLDPAKVDDQASELVRYLTGGVLLRLNRLTMLPEPELAESWQVSPDGKLVTLHLRQGLRFSDGTPLHAADVVATLQRVLAPTTEAPVAEEFLKPAEVVVSAPSTDTVQIRLPLRLVSIASVLDEIAIEPAHRSSGSTVTSGLYAVLEFRQGEYLRLRKNAFYWRHDGRGTALPYLPTLRLDILANRDTEQLRFLQGKYALMDSVTPDTFGLLSRKLPGVVRDLGPSLNTEQMWFNQAPRAPLPAYEKQWFASKNFRSAISAALHREDMAKIAYDGHATPANGFISPTNRLWYNQTLAPVHEDPKLAAQLLAADGFHKQGNQLFDRAGHAVRFSLLTNAGNRSRERMANLIQQDLQAIGIEVHVVTLDFPSLIDRLMHTSDYEAALLGLSNVQPDPGSMMNVWLSSSPNHQWNPSEPTPATPWEAEVDKALQTQAAVSDQKLRKRSFDRVQTLVAEQLPFIYLVYPNTLCAVSPKLEGAQLSVLQPSVVSRIDSMRWKGDGH